jgi:hypothetical protein
MLLTDEMQKVCYILYQAKPTTLLGKGILVVMQGGNKDELITLLMELKDLLTDWPEVLRTTFEPAQVEELKGLLTKIFLNSL